MNKTIVFSEHLEKYQKSPPVLPYSQFALHLFLKEISPHPNQLILLHIMS